MRSLQTQCMRKAGSYTALRLYDISLWVRIDCGKMHLIIEVALEVAAAAAKAEHGAHIRQQLPQSRQEVLIKPGDVRMAQLLPVSSNTLLRKSALPPLS